MQSANEVVQPSDWQIDNMRGLRRLALTVLAVGVVWRIMRYAMRFPIWGDEAMLALNLLQLDYHGLTQRLSNCQIAPILFLWGELATSRLLGCAELSLRLLPFLAGMGSLFLFYRLARQMLASPLASGLAVGFLAVAIWPVSMCSLIKPYSFDLLLSLVLLLPAVRWLKDPEKTWRLALLTLLAPLAILGSYPAVFIAGAVSLTLLWPVYQRGGRATRILFVAYNLVVLASFGVSAWIGSQQLNTPAGTVTTAIGMEQYWAAGFPPNSPLEFLIWFVSAHTGQMMALPIGAAHGGSVLTVLFCVVGAWQWKKTKQWRWLVLSVSPFALGLIAAFMHRYPYGAAGRLSQHIAPLICILAGLGVATLIDRPEWTVRRRWQWAYTAFLVLGLIGVTGMIRDVIWPYHDVGAAWTRDVMAEIRTRVPAGEKIVMCNRLDRMGALFQWYWTTQDERVTWSCQFDDRDSRTLPDQLWAFCEGDSTDDACESLRANLVQHDPAWRLAERIPFSRRAANRHDEAESCELFRFVREGTGNPIQPSN